LWLTLMLAVPRVSAFVGAPLLPTSGSSSPRVVSSKFDPAAPRPFFTAAHLAATDGDQHADELPSPDSTPVVVPIEGLTQDQIAELIEISFIQACLSLAQGYVDTLKLMIVAVQASYERGTVAVQDLVTSVNECPTNTAGRPLMPDEVALRSTWIHAVHLMLEHIGHHTHSNTILIPQHQIDSTVRATYTPILDDVVVQAKQALQGDEDSVWNTNDFVARHQDVLPDAIWEDPVEMAMVSQTIKVLYFTLVVLAEERLANLEEGDDDDDEMPVTAKPKIPRGTGFN